MLALAAADDSQKRAYESRNRNKNKDPLVIDDIWYFSGQIPPRKIDLGNLPQATDPSVFKLCLRCLIGCH